MDKKVIVVTGSTRGIGFGLAECFLNEGHKVVITGTSQKSLDAALEKLEQFADNILPVVCNVTDSKSVEHLVSAAHKKHNHIDIWINNAGVNHPSKPMLELEQSEIDRVIDINVHGVINGSRAIGKYMLKQGFGAIYNMEGLGSDGRIADGSEYYGITKRMVRYYTKAMAREFKNSEVIVGRLSPGMVLTDLLLKDLDNMPDKESTMKIFKILADRPEVVTEFLSKKILANKKNDAYIAWLTTGKIMFRFMTASITKRNPFEADS